MEIIGFLILLVFAAWVFNVAFMAGKREGSRKGYGVGFSRGRRSRGQTGCLVVMVTIGVLAIAVSKAVAHLS